MRRRFAYLLLALYLCVSTEGYQLLKVPLLALHFAEHCRQDPEMTLVSFLVMHYQEEMVYDDDWQEDMQLPFKECAHIQFTLAASLRAEMLMLQEPQAVIFVPLKNPSMPHLHSLLQVTDIFQPPRV